MSLFTFFIHSMSKQMQYAVKRHESKLYEIPIVSLNNWSNIE